MQKLEPLPDRAKNQIAEGEVDEASPRPANGEQIVQQPAAQFPFDQDALQLRIDRTFPLDEAAAALQYREKASPKRKVVIVIA